MAFIMETSGCLACESRDLEMFDYNNESRCVRCGFTWSPIIRSIVSFREGYRARMWKDGARQHRLNLHSYQPEQLNG